MSVQIDLSALRKSKWTDYTIRFVFGGLITAFAGYLTTTYGPAVGGLFLGFPAILPASLTLVKKHEGKKEAGEDARGAIAGSAGLVVFAALVWGLAARLPAWLTLLVALAIWFVASWLVWLVVRRDDEAGDDARPQEPDAGTPDRRPA